MTKYIPVSANSVQVNKLARHDASIVEYMFSESILHSNDSQIIMHHSVLLQAFEAKVISAGQSIFGVLDSDSEMLRQVWEDLSLLIRSDYTITMSNINTSSESTFRVVKDLQLNFNTSKVSL